MGNAKTIFVGSDSGARYFAFGDDSQFGDVIVYAFIFVATTRVRAIERKITELKKDFKIPIEVTLHCRTLFSGQQRQKPDWDI